MRHLLLIGVKLPSACNVHGVGTVARGLWGDGGACTQAHYQRGAQATQEHPKTIELVCVKKVGSSGGS